MNDWVRTVLSIWLFSLSIASCIIAIIFIRSEDNAQDASIWYIILVISALLFSQGIHLYKQKLSDVNAIRINPKWISILYDSINSLLGILGAFLLLNLLLIQFDITPIEDEEFGLFMGTYYFIIGIPFVAFYTCRIAGQIIMVTEQSILTKGIFSSKQLKWEEVSKVHLHDEYIVQGRVGVLIPRKLQKQLILESQNGKQIVLNEPQTKKAKVALFHKLMRCIPEELKPEIQKAFEDW